MNSGPTNRQDVKAEPGSPSRSIDRPKIRADWVDSAKGISICLVVLWHTAGTELFVNNLLIFVRMPLFFFAAGFFAGKAITGSWANLLKNRCLNYYYIYVVWMTIFFIAVVCVREFRNGTPLHISDYLINFISPLEYLWFIFALALLFAVAKVARLFPKPLVIGLLLLAYAISVADGEWEPITFATRMARLPLFFILGTYAFTAVNTYSHAYRRLWPVTLAAFLALSGTLIYYDIDYLSPLTLVASALGIFTVCQFCQAVEGTTIAAGLGFIGRRTLYIYLLHKILIVYIINGFAILGLAGRPITPYLVFAVALPLSLFGGLVLARIAPWLFEAPWVGRSQSKIAAAS
ncbi:acyltransferase family protein [Xanthobacter versatilis]|uniref:acyltransferase family protein n=1 Tax=Xanthobacter autotrophicus (strain ATCC BAA-1158 / Py2) TaxID=78245 RepID=UPI0037285D4D